MIGIFLKPTASVPSTVQLLNVPLVGVPNAPLGVDAGIPKYKTPMLFVPVGGAPENVSVKPDKLYVLGFCTTPDTYTTIAVVLAGAYDRVNAVVEPLPLNWSNGNDAVVGCAPI